MVQTNSNKVLFRVPYYKKDATQIYDELLSQIQELPDNKWTDFSETDPGVILLHAFCSIGGLSSFNMDNQVKEAFLETARRRLNVARGARQKGYEMAPSKSGMAEVSVVLDDIQAETVFIPESTQFSTEGKDPIKYTSLDTFSIPANQCCVLTSIYDPPAGGKIKTTANTDIALEGIVIKENIKVLL